jgi:hypothetical protein
VVSIARFGAFFAKSVIDVYLRPRTPVAPRSGGGA